MQHVNVLVAVCMWDLVPQPGIEPWPPALGARSLTHWTTREVPGVSWFEFSQIRDLRPELGTREQVNDLGGGPRQREPEGVRK